MIKNKIMCFRNLLKQNILNHIDILNLKSLKNEFRRIQRFNIFKSEKMKFLKLENLCLKKDTVNFWKNLKKLTKTQTKTVCTDLSLVKCRHFIMTILILIKKKI